jgi:TRAP-type mannitol/chloroaromatic compound transport system permease small subunit
MFMMLRFETLKEERGCCMAWLFLFCWLVWFVGTTLLLLSVDASGASAVTVQIQWCLFCGVFFCLLEVTVENRNKKNKKDIVGLVVLLNSWFGVLVCCHSHFSISVD